MFCFQVEDILVVNKNYEGDADGSITLHRGDLVEVLKTSLNANGNGFKYELPERPAIWASSHVTLL